MNIKKEKSASTVLVKVSSAVTHQATILALLTVSFASRCFSSNSRTSFFFSSVEEKAACQTNTGEMTAELNLIGNKAAPMADYRGTGSKVTSDRNSLFLSFQKLGKGRGTEKTPPFHQLATSFGRQNKSLFKSQIFFWLLTNI